MAKETIWRPETYRALFQLLTDQFGPHATWEQNNRPGNGRNAEFVQFCATFAELYGIKSGPAVEHIILWGLGPREDATWTFTVTTIRQVILAMGAAFEAGYITHGYFPSGTLTGRRKAKAGETNGAHPPVDPPTKPLAMPLPEGLKTFPKGATLPRGVVAQTIRALIRQGGRSAGNVCDTASKALGGYYVPLSLYQRIAMQMNYYAQLKAAPSAAQSTQQSAQA